MGVHTQETARGLGDKRIHGESGSHKVRTDDDAAVSAGPLRVVRRLDGVGSSVGYSHLQHNHAVCKQRKSTSGTTCTTEVAPATVFRPLCY